MASHRVELSGLPDSGPSTHHPHPHPHHHLPYAILQGLSANTSFINQEGSSLDFGELEEAIVLQGLKINNDEAKLPLYTGRPAATLEMFPSWPIRSLHSPRVVSSRSRGEGESSDSGGYTISSKTEGCHLEAEESDINRKAYLDHHQQQNPFFDQNKNLHHLQHQDQQQQEQQQMDQMASDHSPRTGGPSQAQPAVNKPTQEKRKGPGTTSERALDAKTLRRLAQNREAARKSRLRKKAYVQQLESSRIRLSQLEQDLQRARSQGLLLGGGGGGGNISSGAALFDMEYARWLDDDHRHMAELRTGLHAHLSDIDLRLIVDGYVAHYDEIFRLRGVTTKSDVFHLITGMWATPAERCFLWMGGFRPSELIKMLVGQLDPLTEQQLMGIYNLQHSSQQAEEALSQGLEQLQQSLIETIAGGSINDGMHHMVVALGKLTNLEGFVCQADNLRQQTLHQLHRILTVRQAARCFLVIGEYYGRLRALSSLWASRPRENLMSEDNSCQTTTDLQMVQSTQSHFVNF